MLTLIGSIAVVCAAGGPVGSPDVDSDGDGLSDFTEIHRYLTNPHAADSDGDGVPDGDWAERREFAYSVRTVVRVMRPVTPEFLCDDWQDARVLEESRDWVKLEVIHYPLATSGEAIDGDPRWREHTGPLREYLAPGPTANWDAALRRDLVAALRKDGIDPESPAMDDRTLVERASAWLLEHSNTIDSFTTFVTHFENGKPTLLPDLRDAVESNAKRSGLTVAQNWERELLAKGMFANRTHGSCSSTAIYLCGCLRALGIPARVVLCIPCVDASNREQVKLASRGLTHHRVRTTVLDALETMGRSWASHTFDEVYVGGRWRRLNYSRLGQGILDEQYLGLMTHVATFRDWADAKMATTIGRRQSSGRTDDVFGGPNPYSARELSDQFGVHASVENPPDDVFHELTIEKAYAFDSDERPRIVDMRLDDAETAGHLLVHVRETRMGASMRPYREFWREVDKEFTLQAPGSEPVRAFASRGYWIDEPTSVREFYLHVDPDAFAKLVAETPYRLVPRNANAGWAWRVADGVAFVRSPAVPAQTLEIESLAWSDSSALPADVRRELAKSSDLCLLARVAKSGGSSDDLMRFTEKADARFYLEADGHPTLSVAAATGCISLEGGAVRWIVLPLGPADRRDLASGVTYRLRPRNSRSASRWNVAEGLVARRP